MLGSLANGVPIARVFGLEVRVHFSWVLILAIVTLGAGGQFLAVHPEWSDLVRWAAAGGIALAFFLSVLAHELAHGLVARRRGLGGGVVTLLFFGGATNPGREAQRPSDEVAIAAAGPAASLAIAVACLLAWRALAGTAGDAVALIVLGESSLVLAILNALLAIINLLPVFPLDGGRILRAVLWRWLGSERRANQGVASFGRWVGLVLVGAGFAVALTGSVLDGLMLGISGWFLAGAGRALERRAALEEMLAGVRVETVMDRDLPSVAPQLTLDTFAAQYLAGENTSLPVVRGASLLGLIGVAQVRRIPRASWPTTRAGDVMVTSPALPTLAPEDELWPAVERLRRTGFDGLPVMRGEELLGVLTRRGVVAAIQARARGADAAP